MSHHPSCRPTDKDLVWHCLCGENEPAEEEVLDRLARLREALSLVRDNAVDWTTFPDIVEKVEAALAQDAPHELQTPQCAENWQTRPYSSDHLWRADHHQFPSGNCTRCGKPYGTWHQQLKQKLDEPQDARRTEPT